MEPKTGAIWKNSETYPLLLKDLPDAPACLFMKGQPLDPNDEYFAVVGTRHPSPYGMQMAEEFSYGLSKRGFTVVSGLAYGIDAIAHQAALDAGGKTIAVLGGGMDCLQTHSNRELAQKICGQGTILTEYPANTPPHKGMFPQRNRIIAGMSLATLVIEAPERSGALITARLAGEYNRDVFALPGNITQASCHGTNALIKDNKAFPVTCLDDILRELEFSLFPRIPLAVEQNGHGGLSDGEEAVYSLLRNAPLTIDEIGLRTGLPIPHVTTIISLLELKGLVTVIGSYAFVTR